MSNNDMVCAICQENRFRPVFRKDDLSLVRCRDCGLVQVDNLSSVFDIAHYDYYKDRLSLSKEERYNFITRQRYIALLNKFEPYRKNNALLDIGCGEGHFLSVAKEKNWQVSGIEKAPYAVDICKKLNINVTCSDLLDMDLEPGHYDVVMMSEVLEHLTQPEKYLFKINRILRKGGILRITTPNFNCITRRLRGKKWSLIHKEHLLYFTPKVLRRLTERSNFRIIDFRTKLITLPELCALFKAGVGDPHVGNQVIRARIEDSRILSYLKGGVNSILSLTGLGESIECICQKV